MTPTQKIKWKILRRLHEWADGAPPPENVDQAYDLAQEDSDIYDELLEIERYDVRPGEEETGLPCDTSRHYESKSVASKMPDGSWVGWTYWFGGGKHGEPESIEWMEDAYDLEVTTETRVVNVFKKVEA